MFWLRALLHIQCRRPMASTKLNCRFRSPSEFVGCHATRISLSWRLRIVHFATATCSLLRAAFRLSSPAVMVAFLAHKARVALLFSPRSHPAALSMPRNLLSGPSINLFCTAVSPRSVQRKVPTPKQLHREFRHVYRPNCHSSLSALCHEIASARVVSATTSVSRRTSQPQLNPISAP
jgi:hypothetical protein